MINIDLEGTLEGLYLVRVPKNLRRRVHLGVQEVCDDHLLKGPRKRIM